MPIQCPACGEKNARHQVARPEYDPIAPQFAGGIVMAFVFVLSRKRRFACERCGKRYYAHTIVSRLWLTLWFLFWVSIMFAVIGAVVTANSRN